MAKRPFFEDFNGSHLQKKHKQNRDDRRSSGYIDRDAPLTFSSRPEYRRRDDGNPRPQENPALKDDYPGALSQLPAATGSKADVPAYTPFKVPKGLPDLPEIKDPALREAPFTHKSMASHHHSRSTAINDVTYERLEFLGDAYLELFASRLVYHHYPSLPAGSQSQLRELLVKNETLSQYARAYGFEQRVHVDSLMRMEADVQSKGKGNKGLNKVLGDVFEAYIAAAILSDSEDGFAVVEKWLTALWAPKLIEAAKLDRAAGTGFVADGNVDPLKTYNPTAKAELQKRLLGQDVKLDYVVDKPTVELKGDQLGQNRHFIALYLTGYGHERKLLGKGEGKNKVEAGNWAATEAMFGEAKELVEKCTAEMTKQREARKKEREEKEKAAKETAGKGGEGEEKKQKA